ncbi:MAG: MIP/aquaporin family protein [Gemmatimonadaceae bacterium]
MRDPLDLPRHFVAEFIGTFALTFLGGAAILGTKMSTGVGLLDVALAHGIALAIMVSAFMRISGHFNPAVTVGFLVTGRLRPPLAALYIAGQLAGAIAAAMALRGLFPTEIAQAAQLGGQSIRLDITLTQALVLEAIATAVLVFTVFGTAVDPQGPRVGGLAIGLAVTVDILAIGPLTGASMNPARSFGPALVSGVYAGQVVYWMGPLIGAVLAALLYDRLFLRAYAEPSEHAPIQAAPAAARGRR